MSNRSNTTVRHGDFLLAPINPKESQMPITQEEMDAAEAEHAKAGEAYLTAMKGVLGSISFAIVMVTLLGVAWSIVEWIHLGY